MNRPALALAGFLSIWVIAGSAMAAETGGAAVVVEGQAYSSWSDYYHSDYFAETGRRCGKPPTVIDPSRAVIPSDCTYSFTNPSSDYDTVDVYEIPVVVHIIEHTNGDGQISDAMVASQIEIVNEDFLAQAGTPGAAGYDVGIQFVLASEDPGGSPTTGITRSVNNTWFGDGGSYWTSLAWDTSRYMNVYTNSAAGNLGYVPDLPQGGIAGNPADRVVILWSAFGRDSPGGPPFDQGRTLTHEAGHYLGLEHTFAPEGTCPSASAPACYSSGDLICDTNSERIPAEGCVAGQESCSSLDPIDNYLDYGDDTCMDRFTDEQSHRMRCSLLNYRADLYSLAVEPVCGNDTKEGGEECDGTDATACPGMCLGDCTCPAPVCGNDIIESGEDCDGADPGSCPTGTCAPGCVCPDPVCGNDITESGEDCDGSDDAACPGLCGGGCACPVTCKTGDLSLSRLVADERRLVVAATLYTNLGGYDNLDPSDNAGDGFQMTLDDGSDQFTVDLAGTETEWDAKSRPDKGRYIWKGERGDPSGLRVIKLLDKSERKFRWKIRVKGKDVPGASAIDTSVTVNTEMTIDGVCTEGDY